LLIEGKSAVVLDSILKVRTPALLSTTRGMTEDWSFDMESIKVCPDCGKSKPRSEYNFKNRQKQRYQAYCRPCEKVRHTAFATENRNQELARKKSYYYANRKRLLQYKKDNYELTKPERLLESRNYRLANAEVVKEKAKKYFAENKELVRHHAKLRRVRKKTNGVFLVTLKEQKRLYSQPCFYCGSLDSIQLDHVVPLSRGGTHSIGNLVPACAYCNNQKNKWFITEWRTLKMKWGQNA
jgi:5-methylcytosine-specific restriction endonuclease McrA